MSCYPSNSGRCAVQNVPAAQQAGQEGHEGARRAGGAAGLHGEGGLLQHGRPAARRRREAAVVTGQPAKGGRPPGRQPGQPRTQEEEHQEAGLLRR